MQRTRSRTAINDCERGVLTYCIVHIGCRVVHVTFDTDIGERAIYLLTSTLSLVNVPVARIAYEPLRSHLYTRRDEYASLNLRNACCTSYIETENKTASLFKASGGITRSSITSKIPNVTPPPQNDVVESTSIVGTMLAMNFKNTTR